MIYIIIGIAYFLVGFVYTYVFYIIRFGILTLTKQALFDCLIVGLIWPLIILDYNIKQIKDRKGLLK